MRYDAVRDLITTGDVIMVKIQADFYRHLLVSSLTASTRTPALPFGSTTVFGWLN